jgi:hypothetical protein
MIFDFEVNQSEYKLVKRAKVRPIYMYLMQNPRRSPDQLEEEMDPSATYWRTIISMDLQEDPSPLPGDPRIDHHRRLDAANQVWQGPYWAVRTQNRIRCCRSPGTPATTHAHRH